MTDSETASLDELVIDHVLDTSGLFCPEPLMLLHGKVRDMAGGDVVQVIATDPSTCRDIPKFCVFLSHELVADQEHDGKYYYYIRKGSPQRG